MNAIKEEYTIGETVEAYIPFETQIGSNILYWMCWIIRTTPPNIIIKTS